MADPLVLDVPARRERRDKAARREAIVAAALELFAEHGYERTSVEAITTRAGVSRRTFFNHFAAKEEVLFADMARWRARADALIRAQPADRADLDVLVEVYRELFAPGGDEWAGRLDAVLRRQASRSSATVFGYYYGRHIENIEAVATSLAARRGLDVPDDEAVTAATLGQTLLRLAVDRWTADPDGGPLLDVVVEQFALARAVVLGTAAPAAGRGAAAARRPVVAACAGGPS